MVGIRKEIWDRIMGIESKKYRNLFSVYKRLSSREQKLFSKEHNLSSREQKLFSKELNNISLEIYAELSRKQYDNVSRGLSEITIPSGVTMSSSKRALHFKCESEEIASVMRDALDNSGINWQ